MVTGLNIIGQNKALQDHWIRRLFAYIIDAIILFVVVSIVLIVAIPFAWLTAGFGGVFFGFGALVYLLFALLYWTVQEGFWGATIGKRVVNLRVVGTSGPMDLVKAGIRNISKIYWLFLLLDWLVGLATEGDPRQKFMDRFAGTTVVRTDPQAYMEEQFRQMGTPPPHPVAPAPGYAPPQQWPGQQAPPPGSAPPAQQAPPPQATTWPGQAPPPQTGWPQHQWDEQGRLTSQARFCSACGGPLVPRGDGRMVCSRCGTVY